MSAIDEILSAIPLDQLASRLGTDPDTLSKAAQAALPGLLGGMEANAQDPAGAASLENAIQQHDGALLDGGVNLDDVDASDGEKIVGHVFGGNEEQVVSQLSSGGGVSGDLMKKLLPVLAPVVLAFLAKKFTGGGQSQQAAASQGGGGGGITDLLGGLLGAGGGGGGGLDIGNILGGLLGGGRR
ncbi:MAG: DUF937 domain-containing protein [Thermoleophilia bacterium]